MNTTISFNVEQWMNE